MQTSSTLSSPTVDMAEAEPVTTPLKTCSDPFSLVIFILCTFCEGRHWQTVLGPPRLFSYAAFSILTLFFFGVVVGEEAWRSFQSRNPFPPSSLGFIHGPRGAGATICMIFFLFSRAYGRVWKSVSPALRSFRPRGKFCDAIPRGSRLFLKTTFIALFMGLLNSFSCCCVFSRTPRSPFSSKEMFFATQ